MRFAHACLAVMVLAAGVGCPRRPAPEPVVAPVDPNFASGAWSPEVMQGTPREGGQVVIRITGEPPSLNRLVDSDLWLTRIVKPGIYETLLRIDGDDQPDYPLKPALALGLPEVSADGLTYTFKLRAGVRFHNGDSFSAHDVVSTFNKLMDPKLRGQTLRTTVAGLVEWKEVDPLTVQFRFSEASALTLRQLATSVPIMPSGVLDAMEAVALNVGASINRAPIGTGPWRFESWHTGDRITLVRNADYWDASRRPHLERLIFRNVADSLLAYELMIRGDLDVVSSLTPDQWEKLGGDRALEARYRRFLYFTNNSSFIVWNENRPVFNDKRVRRALAELFDQDRFNDAIAHHLERRLSCPFFAGSPGCDPAVKPVAYDPQGAARLLDESGWKDHDGDGIRDRDGLPLSFHLLYPSNSAKMAKLGPVLEEAYRKAGIELELEPAEWAVMSKRLVDHDFDAAALGIGTNDVESDPYQMWHSSQAIGGSNYGSFADPKADDLIVAGRREADAAKRADIWRALDRELDDQQPFLWLTGKAELEAVNRRIRGIKPGLAYYDFTEWWLEAELPSFGSKPKEP